MITATNLTKSFGSKKAIEDISFHVEKGEVVGFLGPNAAGKTTTMRILTGYFPPTSGEVTIAGFDVFSSSIKMKRQIGYLPEHVPIYPDMKIGEYLYFVAQAKGVPAADIKSRIDTVMTECGLYPEAKNFIGKLSKGFRQRVGIAQAIINKPSVLILDEPTVGLDPSQVVEIRTIIKALSENTTVLLSSHILEEVSKTCSRVIIINKGRVLTTDTPENLANKLQKTDRVYFEVSGSKEVCEEILKAQQGILSVDSIVSTGDNVYAITITTEKDPAIRGKVVDAFVEKKISVYEVKAEKLSLEDIFTQIVRKGGLEN